MVRHAFTRQWKLPERLVPPRVSRLGMRRIALAIALVSLLIPANFLWAPSGGDARSYTAHLATIIYDRDQDYSNERSQELLFPNGQLRPPHSVGSAIVASPVVSIFAVLDILLKNAVIDNRELYPGSYMSIGWRFASLVALALSVVFLDRLLLALEIPIRRPIVFLTLVGSGLGGYFVFQAPEFAHIYSLLVASCLGLCIVAWRYAQSFSRRTLFFTASIASFALALLVRPENIVFIPLWALAVFLLAGTTVEALNMQRKAPLILQFASIPIAGFATFAYVNARLYGIALPLLALRYRQNVISEVGVPGVDSAPSTVGLFESLNTESSQILPEFVNRMSSFLPSILGVFFSPEVGALWFSPLVVVALVGPILLVALRRSNSDWQLAILLALSLLGGLAISTYWRGSGQGYGLRYWYSIFPISFLALGRVANVTSMKSRALFSRLWIAWASFGIAGQFFYDAIPGFYKQTVEPAFFGRPSGYVSGFATQLLGNVLSPQSWVLVAVARLPGWILVTAAPEALLSKFAASSALPSGLRYEPNMVMQAADNLPAMHLVLGAAYVVISIVAFAALLAEPLRRKGVP